MNHFYPLPDEVEAVFGPLASKKFVDYLFKTLSLEREDLVAMSAMNFENRLISEIGTVRLEVAELRTEVKTEIAALRAEVKTDIANIRAEIADFRYEVQNQIADMKNEISDVRNKIAEVRTEIAESHAYLKTDIVNIHREISSQTKWIMTGLGLAVTLYPIISRLLIRVIP